MYSTGSEDEVTGWTPAKAQAALGEVAYQLLAAVDALEVIHAGLPPPADVEDRHEHRKPYGVATDVLATIECVLADNLRPAIASLQRSSQVTDAQLAEEFRRRRQGEP